ncbi:MAG: hypothetical protein Q8O37_07395 [Sulfuricellaceae bacterium]|nr:hypothetical protein [Sulfuricellaceae bacterium]
MIFTDFPAVDPAAKPSFKDAVGCKVWLESQPLTNAQALHLEITHQLDLLSRSRVPPRERLKILEQLREMVAFVASELTRKYRGKAVPLSPLEQDARDKELALWQLFGLIYRQCMKAMIERDASVADLSAMITQRSLHCTAMQIISCGHAYSPVPAEFWTMLHELYAMSEGMGIAQKRIKDALNLGDGSSSCTAIFAKVLLLELADPQKLSSRQLLQIDRWLDKWAAKITFSKERPPTPTLPMIAVDLAGETGAALLSGQVYRDQRFLDLEKLAISMRRRIKFLRGGGNATELDLGEDCVQPTCEAMLSVLYQRWCEAPPPRASARSSSGETAQLCFGFPALYYFLSNHTIFKQPGETRDVSPQAAADMQMYGYVTERTKKMMSAQQVFEQESWTVLDRSTGGFRLIRKGGGERISQNQLLAVRSSEAEGFALAVVRWLSATARDEIEIGVRTLPGDITALSGRPENLNTLLSNPFVPVFGLTSPEMENRETGNKETLILPQGWFQSGKRIQVYDGQLETLKLKTLLEKGANFDQVSFEAARPDHR